MKILIISHYFKPHIGGIEIVAYNQAKELKKKGHKVTIITSKLGREKENSYYKGIKILRVKALNFLENKYDIPYPLFSSKLAIQLIREIKMTDIVITHGALYMGTFYSMLIAKYYKKPIFLIEHVGFVPYKNNLANMIQWIAYQSIGRINLSLSKKIFVLNSKVEKYLKTLTKSKIELMQNGVDTNLFHPVNIKQKNILREKYNLPKNKKLVLFVGRYVEKKGIDLLIKAHDENFCIVMVGQGRLPKEAYTTPGIYLIKPVSQNKLAEIYQACDLFILPSHGEGLPLSIQEAMASGLPIITTKENIPLKLNKDEKAFASYTHLSAKDLQYNIKKLLVNHTLIKSMSGTARKIALSKFNWTKNTDIFFRHIFEVFEYE